MTLSVRHNGYVTVLPIVIRGCLPFKNQLQNSKLFWGLKLGALLLAVPDLLSDLGHLGHPAPHPSAQLCNSTEPDRYATAKLWHGRQHDSFCPSYSLSMSWELLTSLRKKKYGNRIVTDEQNVIHMQNGLANQQELTPCWRKLKKNNRNHYHAGRID